MNLLMRRLHSITARALGNARDPVNEAARAKIIAMVSTAAAVTSVVPVLLTTRAQAMRFGPAAVLPQLAARNGYFPNISATAAVSAACRCSAALSRTRPTATPSQTSCLRVASTTSTLSVPSMYWSTWVS